MSISIDLKNHHYPTHAKLIENIVTLGYNRVPMVLEHGEFAVRGNIIDIYPSNHSHPIRIDYFDNDIDRLNSFNPHSQRSLSSITTTKILKAEASKNRIWHTADLAADDQVISGLSVGDVVVHETHGIGVFEGLVRLTLSNHEGEYIFLKYKGEDKVFVPLDQFHLIHHYSGDSENPPINGLHDGVWKRTKKKISEDTMKMAEEIYLLYKIRQMQPGYPCEKDTPHQAEMESNFPYPLTPDQQKAVTAIKADMEAPRPMDRLLCGDVGYGKTEVIVRAAFKALENGKQVAILVPTTILAQQHYEIMAKRFIPFGYCVSCMSRFQSKKEQEETLKKLKNNTCQIVVGTHRLLQKDIEFSDLGFLVVDEEQRFGVSHKERIKQMRQLIDVLSVSATPIPRTLSMALSGIKDMSIIETPPKEKKPVITTICQYEDEKVATAILEELKRNGQVFYIYNKVQTIHSKAERIKRLLPKKYTVAVAHGQMHEAELSEIMKQFYAQKIDVLVSTTIIENGLDVTTANTILIENADRFGLSQIHQLRGRVGRKNTQGFAYLYYTNPEQLTPKATKRLQAIKEYSALGSGYRLAIRDLEIRGAGEMLGRNQHGHLSAVGFTLYCKMLEDAMHIVKGEPKPEKEILPLDTHHILVPDTYIEDPRERFTMYTRFFQIKHLDDLDNLKLECEDRYGHLPKEVEKVFAYIDSVFQKQLQSQKKG